MPFLKLYIFFDKENEKLKKECAEKTKKIEILNEKISEMLLKNQK